jgi:hypothetical protein
MELILRTNVFLLVMLTMVVACTSIHAPASSTTRANGVNGPGKVPLMYGTNLALFDSRDQIVNDRLSQQVLRSANVPIVRMPFRSARGAAFEKKALEAIRYIGAIPVVIIHGPPDASALADDRQLLALVQRVFGNSLVYVEFGNETDLVDEDIMSYVVAWNTVVSALKAMAPTYRFIGPAASYPKAADLATFTRLATPRPDALSWHEYACHGQDSDEDCIARLSDWRSHLHSVNQAVQAATGATAPIMITEWNLDDRMNARSESAEFMRAWTARALQTLIDSEADGVIAALQYCVANNGMFNLIDEAGSLTPQGQTFFRMVRTSR